MIAGKHDKRIVLRPAEPAVRTCLVLEGSYPTFLNNAVDNQITGIGEGATVF